MHISNHLKLDDPKNRNREKGDFFHYKTFFVRQEKGRFLYSNNKTSPMN